MDYQLPKQGEKRTLKSSSVLITATNLSTPPPPPPLSPSLQKKVKTSSGYISLPFALLVYRKELPIAWIPHLVCALYAADKFQNRMINKFINLILIKRKIHYKYMI